MNLHFINGLALISMMADGGGVTESALGEAVLLLVILVLVLVTLAAVVLVLIVAVVEATGTAGVAVSAAMPLGDFDVLLFKFVFSEANKPVQNIQLIYIIHI